MQIDPKWGNFLFDEVTKTINLIDFRVARDYPKVFVDDYLRMISYISITKSRFEIFIVLSPMSFFYSVRLAYSIIHMLMIKNAINIRNFS